MYRVIVQHSFHSNIRETFPVWASSTRDAFSAAYRQCGQAYTVVQVSDHNGRALVDTVACSSLE